MIPTAEEAAEALWNKLNGDPARDYGIIASLIRERDRAILDACIMEGTPAVRGEVLGE